MWSWIAENSEALQAAGAIFTGLATSSVAFLVYRYTARRDKLDFVYRSWEQQQQANLLKCANLGAAEEFEKIVYGPEYRNDNYTEIYHLFILINVVQNHFFAWKNGILSKKDFRTSAIPTLRLLIRRKDTVLFLIEERGYSKDFCDEIKILLEHAHTQPYDVPPSLLPADRE